jgi:large subunit ribosomal protein L21e
LETSWTLKLTVPSTRVCLTSSITGKPWIQNAYVVRKTGIVYNVTKSAVGVIVNKKVGNRYIEKRINLRIEHVKHSKCRDDFLKRVKENLRLKREAKAKGETVNVKRQPIFPRNGHVVSTEGNVPQTLRPVAYEALV